TFATLADFALDPSNGAIVGLARSNATNATYVFRLKADGSPDNSFDGDGILALTPSSTPPLSTSTHYFSIAVEPDHKMLLAGVSIAGAPRQQITRLLDANGGFINESGVAFGTDGSIVRALAVSPDGSRIADLVTVDNDGTGHEGIGVWMLDGAGLDPMAGFG